MNLSFQQYRHVVAPGLRAAAYNNFLRFSCKVAVELENHVQEKLETNTLKPRQHPGIIKKNCFELPTNLINALKCVIGDYPVKRLKRDSVSLNQYIHSRHPPPEAADVENRKHSIIDEINSKMPLERLAELSEEDQTRWQRKREQYINKRLAQRVYAWKPITYNAYEALVYAIGRGVHEYAVLKRIIEEIVIRDKDFKPRSYFDFGSGVGTGMWVASEFWKDTIFEYYNVDASRHMNDLSELILCDGQENKQRTLRNVYYRQFLPSSEIKYDLVIASHTLFELPSKGNRREVLLNLWRKCAGYLIIVEEGTRHGSVLVNEARRFLLSLKKEDLHGHTFAPCAHDLKCPRITNINDRTPCNFELYYKPLPIDGSQIDRLTARYSYVVLKKGPVTDTTQLWPRLVRPTLVRSKHAICRMCTEAGRLQEVIFTQSKHGKTAYRCAKVSRWGDRLPMAIGEPYVKPNANEIENTSTDDNAVGSNENSAIKETS